MKGIFSSLRRHVREMRVPYLVLVLSLVPTAVIYYRVRINVENRAIARFDRLWRTEQAAIEHRIPRYLDEMFGVRGLYAANATVSPEQWQKYMSSVQTPELSPGIRLLGYLERVPASQKAAFLRRASSENGADVQMQPDGDRPEYFPVARLKYFEPNLRGGIGLDYYYANATRTVFMDKARDSGEPAMTGPVPLTTGANTNVPGLVIYLPVYRPGARIATVPERRAALQGFIFANFDADKLLSTLNGDQNPLIECEIFDGLQMTKGRLLHDDNGTLHSPETRPGQLVQLSRIPVLDRVWTLYFSTLPNFEADSGQNLPALALIAWLTLSVLLFAITRVEVKARSRAEQSAAQLQASEAALAAEKERLAVTLYSIGDGVITADKDSRVLSLNKVAEQLTGWRQDEAVGRPLRELFNVVNETTRETLLPGVDAAAMRATADLGAEKSAILIARDGTERAIANTAAPINDPRGGLPGVVIVFRDITARQKSEAELLKESKLESVGLLAGGIAHDFNNILQGILGNLSLARMNAHSSEKMLERLNGLEKAALRAKDLTQQLVMFARGGAPIRRQVQLSSLVRDATLFALHGSTVQCEFSLPADIWPVEVDEGQFRQVIHNVVLNAMQAMSDAGKIEVRCENVEFTAGFMPPLPAGRYVKISIRDSGGGIRPENLPRIFDPYFTTKTGARGLGLASAYSVVRKHEGQISAESVAGQGTTFRIYLPASLKTAAAAPADGGQTRFFGQGRVLIMDDEDDILLLAGEMLKSMGYEVETTQDGAAALERYALARDGGKPFTAVIMDLTVPEGMGGKECIRRLREMDPHVKAIVSSGYSFDPVMANFREFGFGGVIPKPYVMEELGRVLEEVIGKNATAFRLKSG